MVAKKQSVINLPITLMLTNEGEYYFNRINKTVATRMVLKSYSLKSLQYLIYSDCIAQIEIRRTDINVKRNELKDLSKLISFSILQRVFYLKFIEILKQSPVVIRWIRQNSEKTLNLQSILRKPSSTQQNAGMQKIKVASIDMIVKMTMDYYYKDSEKFNQKNGVEAENKILHGFLNNIDVNIWSLLNESKNKTSIEMIYSGISNILCDYLSKTNIAEYLSLLILELASLIEKDLVEKAVSTYLNGKIDMDHFMRNVKDRNIILQSLKSHNVQASLVWQINDRRLFSNRRSNNLHFIISNSTGDNLQSIYNYKNHSLLDMEEKNLVELYEAENSKDSGLFYINYIDEECQRQGSLFRYFIRNDKDDRPALISLLLRF